MKRFKQAVLTAALIVPCACTSMPEKSDVQLSVTPASATCEARQNGIVVGRYASGQQSISVPNSPGATDIICFADGYKDKRITMVPDGPGTLRAALIDFGPVERPGYHLKVEIAMEAVNKQGTSR